jgi:hypothetical protein
MATQPKPKPKPEPPAPGPDPEDEEAAAPEPAEGQPEGVSLLERVENLENRMTGLEERVNAPPVKLGRRP